MVEWYDHHGWGNGWAWLAMVTMMLLIVAVTVLLVRHLNGRHSAGSTGGSVWTRHHSAEDVLMDRFARGEIGEAEYRRRRDALRG